MADTHYSPFTLGEFTIRKGNVIVRTIGHGG